MITYKIISNSGEKPSKARLLKPGTPDFKERVLERAVKGCKLAVGEYVKLKGTALKGEIKEIRLDVNAINWKNNQPQFVVVEVNGKEMLAHHSQLKRSRKK